MGGRELMGWLVIVHMIKHCSFVFSVMYQLTTGTRALR
jgi:hypothetical protein